MNLDVPITGTDYRTGVYSAWLNSGSSAGALKLQRHSGNPHDRYAVRVMFQEQQMGWIGRSHSEQVAQQLDLGRQVDVVGILRNDKTAHAMERLTVRVFFDHTYDALNKAAHVVTVFGAPSANPGVFKILARLPVGTLLPCDSTPSRTSVDLIYRCERIAWFRKEEQGSHLSSALCRLADRGEMVALITSQSPTTISLHEKGHIKEPDTACQAASAADAFQNMIDSIFNPAIITKETTMNINSSIVTPFLSRLFDRNSKAAGAAAYLETGRIANNTVAKIVIGRLPFLARFYAKTPLGKLAIANAAMLLAQQVRPNDERLKKLSDAMTTVAYQELIQLVDVEGMVDEFLAHPALKRALEKNDTTDFKVGGQ